MFLNSEKEILGSSSTTLGWEADGKPTSPLHRSPVTDVTRILPVLAKRPSGLGNHIGSVDRIIELRQKPSVNLRYYTRGLCDFSLENENGGGGGK